MIGIDLGTTNSLVAHWKGEGPETIPNALGEMLTPSVVGLEDSGKILVGQAAAERLVTHPELTAACFKRSMGTNKTYQLGKHKFRSEELSAFVLKALKADAEHSLGAEQEDAVITVPAYFNDAQRKATKAAAEIAGFKKVRLLNEPTAAALAYGCHERTQERKFAVLDLGGGTFDVSILDYFEGVMEVRACAGDNYLGGEDFVDVIASKFERVDRHPAKFKDEGERRRFMARVRSQAERLKRRLSSDESSVMNVEWEGGALTLALTALDFESGSKALLDRLCNPIERAVRDSKLRLGEIDQVLLAGGATRMPMVRRLFGRLFGKIPGYHIDPDRVVGLGAAVQAGLMAKEKGLKDMVMTDVCPYTLGVEVVGHLDERGHRRHGLFLPIIERNTVVPVSRSQALSTVEDNQTEILLKVFQGESRLVKDNVFLGDLSMRVPKNQAGLEGVDVRFTYEVSGLLEVEAKVHSSGLMDRIVIEQNPGILSPEEIREKLARLAALKVHPRELAVNTALMARADRVYEEYLGDARSALSACMEDFENALDNQDPGQIEARGAALKTLLDQIEGTSQG